MLTGLCVMVISYEKKSKVTEETQLICTSAAEEIIKEGQALQKDFLEHLFDNIDTATKEAFFMGMKQIEDNLDKILKRR